jgi:hypothetical protein
MDWYCIFQSGYVENIKTEDGREIQMTTLAVKPLILGRWITSINKIIGYHHIEWVTWSYGSWIYNYLGNQCLSLLKLWVNPTHGEVYLIQHYVMKFVSDLRQVGGFLYTTLCDEVCQWLATDLWFSLYNIMWWSLSVTFDGSVVFSIQHYVMKFVSDLRQVGGFLQVFWFAPPIKLNATI